MYFHLGLEISNFEIYKKNFAEYANMKVSKLHAKKLPPLTSQNFRVVYF